MAKRNSVLGFGADVKRSVIAEVTELDQVRQSIKSKFQGNDSTDPAEKTIEKPAVIEGNDSSVTQEDKAEVPAKAESDALTVDASVLKSLIDSAIATATKPFADKVTELEKTVETSDAAKAEAEEKLQISEDSAKKLANLFSTVGSQTDEDKAPAAKDKFPNVNVKYGADSGLEGAARDFVGMLESDAYTPTKQVLDSQMNILATRDYRQLTSFWKANKDAVRNDMANFARKHGMLQGWKAKDFNADAATLKADIPAAFLTYLSMVMRETHSPSFIYWQFVYDKLELGKQPGDNILVPRFSYLPTATSVADRQLTPGTPISNSRQPLSTTTVGVTLEELGLNLPVAIPEFIQAYSMVELEGALQSRLGYDYEHYNDYRIRSLYAATTKVVYPQKTEVCDVPANLAAGDVVQISEGFLNSLFAYMRALKIPTYDNGCYAIIVHTNALKQLSNSMLQRKQFITMDNLEDITNILNAAKAGEMGKASGYIGTVSNFMIFETNVHSLGAVGTEGVRNETIAGSAKVTRSSYAFGRNAVAKATGMEMEVRKDSQNDFGRLNSFTWLHHAGYGHLDCDPAINANQQLRVLELRTTDVVV